MFIDRAEKSLWRGSEGRNEAALVLVKLSSAPPNRARRSQKLRAINMSPLTGWNSLLRSYFNLYRNSARFFQQTRTGRALTAFNDKATD